jgi:hypothetical protein
VLGPAHCPGDRCLHVQCAVPVPQLQSSVTVTRGHKAVPSSNRLALLRAGLPPALHTTQQHTTTVVLKPCDVAISFNSSAAEAANAEDASASADAGVLAAGPQGSHSSTTLGLDSTALSLMLTPDTLKLVLQVLRLWCSATWLPASTCCAPPPPAVRSFRPRS